LALLSVTVLRNPSLIAAHPARAVDVFTCLFVVSALALLVQHAEESTGRESYVAGALIGLLAGLWYGRAVGTLVLVAAWVLAAALLKRRRSWLAMAPTTAAVAAIAVASTLERAKAGISFLHEPMPRSLVAVAGFARDSSPRNAVFLIPPLWSGFRAMALRSPFVTFKEGAAALWQQSYVYTWISRMQAIGFDLTGSRWLAGDVLAAIARAYQGLDDSRVCAAASEHRIDYWVTEKGTVSAFPVVWSTADVDVRTVRCPRVNRSE
jgi:hypothetical protein